MNKIRKRQMMFLFCCLSYSFNILVELILLFYLCKELQCGHPLHPCFPIGTFCVEFKRNQLVATNSDVGFIHFHHSSFFFLIIQ